MPGRVRSIFKAPVFWLAGCAVGVAALSLPFDLALSQSLSGLEPVFLGKALIILDQLTGKGVSNFLLGPLLILLGAISLAIGPAVRFARPLLYLGTVQFLSTCLTDFTKVAFGRLRPFEAIDSGGSDIWFAGGNAFPSGHAGFYGGLLVPLCVIAPRWSPLWIGLLVFIAAQRVLSQDHYLSDVSVSIAAAALIAVVAREILGARPAGQKLSSS